MTIQEFCSQWWVSGIVLPAFFTLVVGAAVNLWAGFVIADLLTFRQLMRETANEIYLATGPAIVAGENGAGMRFQQRHLGAEVATQLLIQLGQTAAAVRYKTLAQEAARALLEVEKSKFGRFQPGKALGTNEMSDLNAELARLFRLVVAIGAIKPDYRILFFRPIRLSIRPEVVDGGMSL